MDDVKVVYEKMENICMKLDKRARRKITDFDEEKERRSNCVK